jgi:peptidoglycan/LPS O-acetylase OafA/YrhL
VSRESSFSYRPALDGLRAFAVVAVILYHLNDYHWARGGYLGVDAFFVLSGYLITSLLLGEHKSSGTITLSSFWGRRAKRLLPAVLLVVLAIALYSVTWAQAEQFDTLRKDGWATLGYVANWRFIASGQSYFSLFSAPSPFRHMWSLAIEEQFYVFWPLVTFGLLRWGRGRRTLLTGVTVAGIAVSTIWMAVHFDVADPSRVYYGTDTRAHSLLVGCLLAIILERVTVPESAQRPLQIAGIVAAVGVLWAVHSVADSNETMYRGGFLLYAVGVAVVVAAAVQTTWSPLRALLSPRPLRWIGQISYGLYLWHWPAIVILTPSRMHVHGDVLNLLRVAITFAVSSLSFYLVERPIRYGHFPNRAVLAAAPVAIVSVAIVLAGATVGAKAAPFHATAPITAPPTIASTAPPRTVATTSTVPPSTKPGAPTTASTAPPLQPMTIAIVGDSVADSMSWGLEQVAQGTPVRVVSSAFPGCGIASGWMLDDNERPFQWTKPCYDNVPRVLKEVVAGQQPDVVLWSSSWELTDRLDVATNQVLHFGTKAADDALLRNIDEAATTLTSAGARLVILTVPPRGPSDVRPADGPDARFAHYTALLRRYVAQHRATTSLVDIIPFVCPGGAPCPAKVHGVTLRPDGGHFTHETSPLFAQWLFPKLTAFGPRSAR